jgi:hypothetical protein
MGAMRSKYRQRVRSARKRARDLDRVELDCRQLVAHADVIDHLLAPVISRADVSLAPMTAATLVAIKGALGDSLRVVLYRVADASVGFAVSLRSGDVVEAMLVGMDDRVNGTHKLYQNILYDFVEHAIDVGATRLDLGRTALEIKSSMGARPYDFPIYVRHPSPPLNWLLGFGAARVPGPEWVARSPFSVTTG